MGVGIIHICQRVSITHFYWLCFGIHGLNIIKRKHTDIKQNVTNRPTNAPKKAPSAKMLKFVTVKYVSIIIHLYN